MTTIQTFKSAGGARITQIPLEEFPGFWGFAYLVQVGDYCALVDTGSGFETANEHLESGLAAAGVTLGDLTHVFITHGHIDHFGGLSYVQPRTQAEIWVHELDRRNVTNYEERLAVVSRRLDVFLAEAGVSEARRRKLLDLYQITKALYRSVPVTHVVTEEQVQVGPFHLWHLPGHSAGMMVIRLHDVLFSGDHVLADISPHQAPERLTLYTGLGHYLASLNALRAWAPEIRLTLGGHKAPITDLAARIAEIEAVHAERLHRVEQALTVPHTVAEVSRLLFGEVHGYNVLLALEEAGAHVEYLYQRGRLAIANLDELENGHGVVPIQYVGNED